MSQWRVPWENFFAKSKTINSLFPLKSHELNLISSNTQTLPPVVSSKILPLIHPSTTPRIRPDDNYSLWPKSPESEICRPPMFPAAEAAPYVSIQYPRACHRIAPSSDRENRSARLLCPSTSSTHHSLPRDDATSGLKCQSARSHETAVRACAAPSVRSDRATVSKARGSALIEDARRIAEDGMPEFVAVEEFKELKI